jgi:GNAT superfamily N-acetyltransferase
MIEANARVRLAESGDVDALLPLITGYRVFYRQQPDSSRERAFLQSHLQSGTSTIYIAESNGTIAGFTQLFKTFSTVHLSCAYILEDLYVLPEYRGGGIATSLLERACRHAQDAGASGMFLETAFDNHDAQRVYQRCGWTREDRFFKYNAPLERRLGDGDAASC